MQASKGRGAADLLGLGNQTALGNGTSLVLGAAAEGSWAAGRVQKVSTATGGNAAWSKCRLGGRHS